MDLIERVCPIKLLDAEPVPCVIDEVARHIQHAVPAAGELNSELLGPLKAEVPIDDAEENEVDACPRRLPGPDRVR